MFTNVIASPCSLAPCGCPTYEMEGRGHAHWPCHLMHWVVRYFLNKSRTWDHLISGTSTSTGTLTSSVGIIAYVRWKQQTWHNLAHSVDGVVATMSSTYKSKTIAK